MAQSLKIIPCWQKWLHSIFGVEFTVLTFWGFLLHVMNSNLFFSSAVYVWK